MLYILYILYIIYNRVSKEKAKTLFSENILATRYEILKLI